jgi:proline iminopeptidase
MVERVVVTDDGARLWASSQGNGPPVVLCHGGPGLWDYLGPVADMISDVATVHRYDQRGSGRSSHLGPFTLERFVQDLDSIRQDFGYERWTVGGHSWGATLALLYCLTNPHRVESLIYICGTGLAWSKWKRLFHAQHEARLTAQQLLRYKELKQNGDRSADEEHEYNVLNDIPNYAEPAAARDHAEPFVSLMSQHKISREVNQMLGVELDELSEHSLIEKCQALRLPVLIVHGESDPRPFEAVGTLLQALPRKEVIMIQGAGHMPWVERPDRMRNELRRFLVGEVD